MLTATAILDWEKRERSALVTDQEEAPTEDLQEEPSE